MTAAVTAQPPGRLWHLRLRRGADAGHVLQFRNTALDGYRLEVRIRSGAGQGLLIEYLENLGSALRVARHYVQPVELWLADDHLCTIEKNVAGDGTLWTITPGLGDARRRESIRPQQRRIADPQSCRKAGKPQFSGEVLQDRRT